MDSDRVTKLVKVRDVRLGRTLASLCQRMEKARLKKDETSRLMSHKEKRDHQNNIISGSSIRCFPSAPGRTIKPDYKKENDPFSALAAIEEFLALQDSLRVTPPKQSLIRGRQTYHELPGPASGRGLAAAKRPGAFSVLSLVLALVAAVLYFYGKYRHRNVSLEHERLIGSMGESARLLRESEIENAGLKENLQAIRMRYLAAYKKQFSRITTIIEKYYASSGMKKARDIVYKEVMDIAGTIGSDSTRMGVLERDVNAALDNAMKWFREEFPDKSPAYYNMVCLFMAGFTTPMIEIMTGVPRNTLYSKKRRLLEEIRGSDAVHKDLLMMMIK